jgi:hypothetical protein
MVAISLAGFIPFISFPRSTTICVESSILSIIISTVYRSSRKRRFAVQLPTYNKQASKLLVWEELPQ